MVLVRFEVSTYFLGFGIDRGGPAGLILWANLGLKAALILDKGSHSLRTLLPALNDYG